jgi:UDP-3-O-[3-hydroxymyristoyl] glucosamine N-acyltransferase
MQEFLRPGRGLTISEIAELTQAQARRGTPADLRIRGIAPLEEAGVDDISFLDNAKHLGDFAATRAGACFVVPRLAASASPGLVILVTAEPYRAFVLVARALFPEGLRASSLFEAGGRATGASVHPSARIEAGVTVDPLAVIGPRAEIGDGTLIASGAVIGPDVRIGRHCAIGAGATIQHALIGDRVIVHAGARLGEDGSAWLPGPQGPLKIPQVRRVIIQDDVEIGANATIDRGSSRDTVIGEGSKIDNLVKIAHNVGVGRHCLIGAQSGLSAGATVEDYVIVAAPATDGNGA